MFTLLKIYEDVIDDPRLRSLEEKLIVSHILQFQNEGKCCFTSNARIGRFLSRDEGFVSETIFSLSKRGIIRITRPIGGSGRILTVVTPGDILDCAKGDMLDIFEF